MGGGGQPPPPPRGGAYGAGVVIAPPFIGPKKNEEKCFFSAPTQFVCSDTGIYNNFYSNNASIREKNLLMLQPIFGFIIGKKK